MRSDKKDIRKVRLNNLIFGTSTVTTACLYYGLRLGNVIYHSKQEIGLFEAMATSVETIFAQPFVLFPSDWGSVLIFLTVALIADIYMLNEYIIREGAIDDAQGDAAFEEDFRQYDKEFYFDPKIALPIMGKKVNKRTTYMLDAKDDEEEHKKVIRRDMDLSRREKRRAERMLKNKKLTPELVELYLLTFSKKYRAIYECRMQSQIYAQGLYLGLNGSWTQRNANAIVFGASGAGKSRFFLKPNILQANGCFIVTDPSGDIMQGLGGFLKLMGYTVKCFNVQDMTESCRFNPLYYVRKTTDIPIIVNTLIENTRGENVKPGGGDPFWDKATQSLLCAIIGYLFEVCPIEQRNFANVLEILNMAQIDEGATEFGDNDFDKLFKELGKADPSSYAYLNYKVFKQAPAKKALNVLISTGVLLSQYIGIHEFNNLTFKDELELDKIGEEKYALFLNIPQEDTTYSWITAMLYSTVSRLMYAKGNKRMKDEGLDNQQNLKLAYQQVYRNKGASGVDGMEVKELKEYLNTHIEEIKEQIRNKSYKPKPVRRVEIPKDNGGARNLGVPTVLDRFIQQAIAQVLTPIYESIFSDNSYGFRPNRCCEMAIIKALEYMNDGFQWVVDIDLEKFFDNVNHDKLISLVMKNVKCGEIVSLIRKYLVSGIMIDDEFKESTIGTPQGGNLSPLLSNIMLNELDKEL